MIDLASSFHNIRKTFKKILKVTDNIITEVFVKVISFKGHIPLI